jgi:hypothetical protein
VVVRYGRSGGPSVVRGSGPKVIPPGQEAQRVRLRHSGPITLRCRGRRGWSDDLPDHLTPVRCGT